MRIERLKDLEVCWFARLPANVRAMLWMVLAVSGFALMAALLKLVTQDLPVFVAILVRMALGVVPLVPWLARNGFDALRTRRLGLHFLRALNGFTALVCFLYALTALTLADVTAIGFARPLWVIPVAFVLLGEKVGWRRASATGVGFLGVLIMIRPGADFDPLILVAIVYSFGSCMTLILVKMLSTTEPGPRIVFYHQFLSFVLAIVPAWWTWQTPTLVHLSWTGLAAFCGTAAHIAFARACALGEATVVAPMEYARLPAASVIGFVLFAELPTIWAVLGTAVIAGATLYIGRRETRRRAEAMSGAEPAEAEPGV